MLSIMFFLIGIIVYSLIEYAVHRWVLHGPMIQHHREHHQFPERRMSVPLKGVVIAFVLAWLITNLALALGIVACWIVSSALHHRLHVDTPDSPAWIAKLKTHHDGHHRQVSTNYGVTNTLWDKTFSTQGKV